MQVTSTWPCWPKHGFVCSISCKGNCWDNDVAERFFLNLKMERVSAITRTTRKPSLTWPITSPAFTTVSDCIRYWAICRPASMNAHWQRKSLSSCPELLDHYTTPRIVMGAESKLFRPSTAPSLDFTLRWSCSIKLFRYFNEQSFVRSASAPCG